MGIQVPLSFRDALPQDGGCFGGDNRRPFSLSAPEMQRISLFPHALQTDEVETDVEGACYIHEGHRVSPTGEIIPQESSWIMLPTRFVRLPSGLLLRLERYLVSNHVHSFLVALGIPDSV